MNTASIPVAAHRSRLSDLMVLTKVRVNALVVATTAGGFYMASPDAMNLFVLTATIIGTALVAGGAAALNQISERDIDRLMNRTRLRPVADGRMTAAQATVVAWGTSIAGMAILWTTSNLLAAAIAAVTLVIYAFVYTPMKRWTSFATVVGAVPGALPPMIGWAAARGTIDAPAWAMFLIVFLWQMPHFLAIAWLYREDYARASLPMLPVVDVNGSSTARQSLLYATALVPVGALPSALGITGALYLVSAVILGFAFLAMCGRFALTLTRQSARQLFLASIIYLPVLWAMMMIDRT